MADRNEESIDTISDASDPSSDSDVQVLENIDNPEPLPDILPDPDNGTSSEESSSNSSTPPDGTPPDGGSPPDGPSPDGTPPGSPSPEPTPPETTPPEEEPSEAGSLHSIVELPDEFDAQAVLRAANDEAIRAAEQADAAAAIAVLDQEIARMEQDLSPDPDVLVREDVILLHGNPTPMPLRNEIIEEARQPPEQVANMLFGDQVRVPPRRRYSDDVRPQHSPDGSESSNDNENQNPDNYQPPNRRRRVSERRVLAENNEQRPEGDGQNAPGPSNQ